MHYIWPLNNMGLNCVGPRLCGYFSIVNTTVLQGQWLVESADVKGTLNTDGQLAYYKFYPD